MASSLEQNHQSAAGRATVHTIPNVPVGQVLALMGY